ncbi:sel1 repeat family protein [Salmonella enterica]|nr:sel1 repeat family protein [Salmonella enterica]
MKQLLALMFLITFFAHAAAPEPGSQYLKAAEGGDRRAQYYLADSWFSSGDLGKAEYWAQKAADNGDADACALLAQIKITNPVSLDYPGAKRLAEKAAKAGSKAGEITLARVLVNAQAGRPDYPKAISLLQNASEDLDNDSAVDAQMLLGLIYANGAGIAGDDEKAAWYFKRSSAISRTGYSEYWAGMMFLNGEPGFIEKNKQKALHWLNLSCLEGFDTGCEEFGALTNG